MAIQNLSHTYTEIDDAIERALTLPPKVYKALISQADTDAPVVERVLVNTLGVTPVFTRDDIGVYRITAAGQFPQAQTAMFTQIDGITLAGDTGVFVGIERGSDDFLYIKTGLVNMSGVSAGDGFLTYTLVWIEVYPAP